MTTEYRTINLDGSTCIKTNNSKVNVYEHKAVKMVGSDCDFSLRKQNFHRTLHQFHPDLTCQILGYKKHGYTHYITMERCYDMDEPNDIYLKQMCECIGLLHSYGITHNDISRNNFMLKNNRVVIIDFATVNVIGKSNQRDYVGTFPFYCFEDYNTVNYDLWALGCTLYHLEYGQFISTSYVAHEIENDFLTTLGYETKKTATSELTANMIEKKLPPGKYNKYQKMIARCLSASKERYTIDDVCEGTFVLEYSGTDKCRDALLIWAK